MSIWEVLLILFTGTAAGFLNTLAGGGSLIAIPVLIFMGLPGAVANGTNRVAVMIQNLVAVSNFKRKGFFDLKLSLKLAIPAALGAIPGTVLAVNLRNEVFNKVLAIIMVMVLGLILFNPKKRLAASVEKLSQKRQIVAMIAFFFVGLYGGFIQAGVGFIIIATLSLITGLSLVKINSMKVLIVAFYTLISLAIFIATGKINWLLGLVLAVGNALGAYLGSNFAISKGDKWIRVILTIAILAMATKLAGLFDLIIGLF